MPLPLPFFINLLLHFLSSPYMVPYRESVCDRSTLADPVFFFPDTGCPLACRRRGTDKVPTSRLVPRTPARPVLENAHPPLPVSHPRSCTCAPSDVALLKPSSSIVANFANPSAPGVPSSGHNWVLGAVAYLACWVLWIFGVFLGYEVAYSYYRRWCFREYLKLLTV